jgi:subtilisin family serine protease
MSSPRRTLHIAGWAGLALMLTTPAHGQLVPSLSAPLGGTLGQVRDALPVERTLGDVRQLVQVQVDRARDLVRRYPDRIELDRAGNPVRAGEVTLIDPDDAILAKVTAQGFRLIERQTFDDLGIGYARLRTPDGMSATEGVRRLSLLAGKERVATDPLHFASGNVGVPIAAETRAPVQTKGKRIGIVDGGVAPGTPGLAAQQGFATDAPRANDHAAAIASLLTGGGGIRASAPDAALYVADIFGTDPAGGSATAIARSLAWMVRERVPVVVVSLAGPPNPLLARFVGAARTRGTVVVAAVGNGGPAAPPAYPASYPQSIAVTGVDARGRPLIEAGRASHLDYAAPGADMLALDAGGRSRTVRGTSFAAPLVAARLSAALDGALSTALATLDREAKGRGTKTGRGILCADCRTPPR